MKTEIIISGFGGQSCSEHRWFEQGALQVIARAPSWFDSAEHAGSGRGNEDYRKD